MKKIIIAACMALAMMSASAQQTVKLPEPQKKAEMSVMQALQQRPWSYRYAANRNQSSHRLLERKIMYQL